MTGEMSASEVTPENYPELFKLKRKLYLRGINCRAEPFDKYTGPYLSCYGKKKAFEVWYNIHTQDKPAFLVEYYKNGVQYFRGIKADNFDWIPEIDSDWKFDGEGDENKI